MMKISVRRILANCIFAQTLRGVAVVLLLNVWGGFYGALTAQGLDLDELSGTLETGSHTISGVITLNGDLTVPAEATLIIQAGSTVRAQSFFQSIFVYGTLLVQGTVGAPVTFTSLAASGPDQWGGLVFRETGQGTIRHAVLRYGGGETSGLIDIDGTSSVDIADVQLSDSGGHGIWIKDASPTIARTTFAAMGGSAVFLRGTSYPVFSGDLGPVGQRVEVQTTTLTSSGEWGYAGIPYLLAGDVTVPAEVALTVAPRVVVKGSSFFTSLWVDGTLTAEGSGADSIYFTSQADDALGGDTNGDGSETVPAGNDWGGIVVREGGTARLRQVQLRYGGGETSGLIDIDGTSSVDITDVHLSDSGAHGIWIRDASPTIARTTFAAMGGSAIFLRGTSYPVFSGDLGPVGQRVEVQATTLASSGQWEYAGIPYLLAGDVTVAAGVTLTVAPRVVVKGSSFFTSLWVDGALTAEGSGADSIYFTSSLDDALGGDTNGDGAESVPLGNDWGGVVVREGGTARLRQVQLRYGGGETSGLIDIDGTSSVDIADVHLSYSGAHGIWIEDASPTIARTTFAAMGGSAVFLRGTSYPVFSGDLGPVGQRVEVQTTTLASSGQWGYAGIPYLLAGDVTVPAGVALTVAPRVVVKGSSFFTSLWVDGTLTAAGSGADSIYFTSQADDGLGGDSNGDGTASVPAGDDWGGIVVGEGGTARLRQVQLRYGGGETSGLIDIDGTSSVDIADAHLSNSGGHGIWIEDASPTIARTTFANMSGSAVFLRGTSYPVFSGDLGPVGQRVEVQATTLASSGQWEYAGIPYLLAGDVTVPAGVALTVAPRVVVKGSSFFTSLWVDGALTAAGSGADSIYFTSSLDDGLGGDTNGDGAETGPAGNDWGGIVVREGGQAELAYCRLSYGGGETSGLIDVTAGGQATIEHGSLIHSGNRGLHVAAGGQADIGLSVIRDNAGDGVYNAGDGAVRAVNNWWGDPSGPLDEADGDGQVNVGGMGQKVGDFVAYEPWLGALPNIDAQVAEAGVVAQIGDFNLDGVVDRADFFLFADRFGQTAPAGDRFDLNGDGVVDSADFFLFIDAFDDAAGRAKVIALARGLFEPPAEPSLDANYPNPFNGQTTIPFRLQQSDRVRIDIFNALGQRVRTLIDRPATAGRHRVVWDGRDEGGRAMASGIYVYRMVAGDFTARRMLLYVR